ncbi:uncharacterized [Tachysurus ichikawai]
MICDNQLVHLGDDGIIITACIVEGPLESAIKNKKQKKERKKRRSRAQQHGLLVLRYSSRAPLSRLAQSRRGALGPLAPVPGFLAGSAGTRSGASASARGGLFPLDVRRAHLALTFTSRAAVAARFRMLLENASVLRHPQHSELVRRQS